MDNQDHDKEQPENERRNSSTEYIPKKCRITKPAPPKPATNPLQFIKVAPCPLFQKAQEQIKKVEEVKKEEKEMREEVEDWQQNLDNWKSSRRKRQEHIIERVVEVKKLTEQEETDKTRRRCKTFSEMMEERSRGRHKFNIVLYDDDSNDLSDYGIGSSKTNSVKDVDTDDSSSILDEKDVHSFDSSSNRENSSLSNQSQSEDETNVTKKETVGDVLNISNNNVCTNAFTSTYTTSISTNKWKPEVSSKPSKLFESKVSTESKENAKQYTYEGAIQDYRSRIQSTINMDESIFIKKSKGFSEALAVLPKGEIFKRKELFEGKNTDLDNSESTSSRRLSEDLTNARSIKDRLKSLEKPNDQSSKTVGKNDIQVSVKQRLQNFNKQTDIDSKNNNIKKTNTSKISNYIIDKSKSMSNVEIKKPFTWRNDTSDRCFSPETEIYVNKLNMFNKDLDNLIMGKSLDENLDYSPNSNYQPSMCSGELAAISSDRDDSGIHTADVSCSVSQADEPIDTDPEIALNHIPSYIKNLGSDNKLSQFEKDLSQFETELDHILIHNKNENYSAVMKDDLKKCDSTSDVSEEQEPHISNESVIKLTKEFIEYLIKDAAENMSAVREFESNTELLSKHVELPPSETLPVTKPKPVIYENVDINRYSNGPSVEFMTSDFIINCSFPVFSPMIEPPKVKPPPPPTQNDDDYATDPMKRVNSTKRIKKEIHIKRSSFLGLDEPTDDLVDPDVAIEKPPDMNSFFQKESKLEKSLYKKIQEPNQMGVLSKVESQDSGLDIDRGRLSSDTWCSSVLSHERQTSEPTNSITSEEDEITKKEREIIEMVEKEEQFRDTRDYTSKGLSSVVFSTPKNLFEPALGSEEFNRPYFRQPSPNFLDDQDSEVLKVEQELRQLELEELDRQCENLLFRESRTKAQLQNNRHSLENIYDKMYPNSPKDNAIDYRKSMPELQHIPLDCKQPAANESNYVYENLPETKLQYRKSVPNIQHAYQESPVVLRKPLIDIDLRIPLDHRKSMPELQHAYPKTSSDYRRAIGTKIGLPLGPRKSMPDLQHDMHPSAFKAPSMNRPSVIPVKPLKKDWSYFDQTNANNSQQLNNKGSRQLSKQSSVLSAVPRARHIASDKWIQPKINPEVRSYNQHWVYQEAEMRRISDQQKNLAANKNWQHQPRYDKHMPSSSNVQPFSKHAQNRTARDLNQPNQRPEGNINRDYMQQHSYSGHHQTVDRAFSRMTYYSPPVEQSQDRILSVSGKKKCSYCGNELGRGAAMIIESLCLFYHMNCFECCVCHIQLGDGLMGTDVRVRNQKLHCHNCYSSDDGVKFSCV